MSETNQREITLKDLAAITRKWYRYLWSKWLLILIIGLTGGLLGAAYAIFSKPTYEGELTFVLSSNTRASSLASLAGQFGIDFGMSNDDVFSGDNIIELFKSKKIIKNAIFRPLATDSSETLADLIVDKSKMKEGWEKDERAKNLLPFPKSQTQLTPLQDSLVSELYDFIVKTYLTIEKIDTKLSFYRVAARTTDERISCYLSTNIADAASKFYIETKTKTAKENLAMLQHEADSLRYLLGSSIVSAGLESDKTFNLNPAYQVQRSGAQQSQFSVNVLATAYGEVVKNLEIAKITLQKETPLFQIIDTPRLPLKKESPALVIFVGFGGFVFGVLIIGWLTLVYIFKHNYSENPQ